MFGEKSTASNLKGALGGLYSKGHRDEILLLEEEILLLDPSPFANCNLIFPLSSYMMRRGFGSSIGLKIVNCLKSQVFEWVKDS